MNITTKIIITDTNIITDLYNANILEYFVMLDNVYINDIIKNDEINFNTGNIDIINKFKTIKSSEEQIIEMLDISKKTNGLSNYDIINYIISRDNNAFLATGDQKLKNYSESNGVKVIRTLKIIELMKINNIINKKQAIEACKLLINNNKTRIPSEFIIALIVKLEDNII